MVLSRGDATCVKCGKTIKYWADACLYCGKFAHKNCACCDAKAKWLNES